MLLVGDNLYRVKTRFTRDHVPQDLRLEGIVGSQDLTALVRFFFIVALFLQVSYGSRDSQIATVLIVIAIGLLVDFLVRISVDRN